MTTAAISYFVFVDFENVHEVDLGLVEGKPAHVTLLIGKNQKNIPVPLVQQIHRLAAQVELVEVGASGRNALDLTLAYYLGQAVLRAPDARFCIVSGDKDFDPMIAHLAGHGVKVVRCSSFAALPFLPKPKTNPPARAAVPVKSGAPVKAVPSVAAGISGDRLERLVARLQNSSAPRPKKKSSLLARINSDFGNKLTAAEQNEKAEELIRRGVLSIDAKGKIAYATAQQ
jgi:hypothetical protein